MTREPARRSSTLGRHRFRPGGRGAAATGSPTRLASLRASRQATRLSTRQGLGLRPVPLIHVAPRGTHRVSDHLAGWLASDDPSTLGLLAETFGAKIFPVACLVLMAPSALPIPTGGANHVLDVIALVFAAQIALAREKLWLPARWRTRALGPRTCKAMGYVVRAIHWSERFARPRGAGAISSRLGQVVLGLVMIAFILGAMFSPPFSGLDTLPSLGAAVLGLGLVLEDLLFVVIGIALGAGGIGLSLTVGAKALRLIGF